MYRSMEKLYKKSKNHPWSRLWHRSQFVNSYCQYKAQKNKTIPKYDLENIDTKYTIEVKNRFSILQVNGKNPEDLWIDIRYAVIETAEKWIAKVKKRKVTKWLTEETIKIAEERI